MQNVCFVRPELKKVLPMYRLIADALAGETAVKEQTTTYLPMVNPGDTSTENKARYRAYLTRAVFYNVTRRTLLGLIGQVFSVDPVVKVPAILEPVLKDATGTGVNLVQLSKKCLGYTLAYSRAGVFVDYPRTSGEGTTVKELQDGFIRPTISVYEPQNIINWRVVEKGSREILSLVVLYESYTGSDDGFEIKLHPQIRGLVLKDNVYVQLLFREKMPTEFKPTRIPSASNFEVVDAIPITGSDGNPLTEIPFSFVGSENNDSEIDSPNMYDIASLNIAHFRNSADYEEMVHWSGQPTAVISGVTQEWVEKVLNGVVALGSRGGIPLPAGADAKLLEISENGTLKEAMETKERQMVALGAKLVEQKQVQRTAFETKVEATSEGSILASCSKNVSSVFKWALDICASFSGADSATIEFELNSDFDIAKMSVEEQRQTVANWKDGAVTFEEMRNVLRKAGAELEKDEVAKTNIKKEAMDNLALEAAASGVMETTVK